MAASQGSPEQPGIRAHPGRQRVRGAALFSPSGRLRNRGWEQAGDWRLQTGVQRAAFPAAPYGLNEDRLETGDRYCLRSDRNKPLRLSRFPRSGPTVPDAIAREGNPDQRPAQPSIRPPGPNRRPYPGSGGIPPQRSGRLPRRWAPYVRVLAPRQLRERVRERLRQGLLGSPPRNQPRSTRLNSPPQSSPRFMAC